MAIHHSTYNPEWQQKRIDFMLSKYPKEFFQGKRILELGAFNGYIGAYFKELGAEKVCSIEGRLENYLNMVSMYPMIECVHANLDIPTWEWGNWDIIINFGLYYHLEKYHKEHLENCVKHCNTMFFESVIFDSFDAEIYFRNEVGQDQSLSNVGGYPSTSYVENIFKQFPVTYEKFTDGVLNKYVHHYDWVDRNTKVLSSDAMRRFWIVNKL